jgi:hypothetical protein
MMREPQRGISPARFTARCDQGSFADINPFVALLTGSG